MFTIIKTNSDNADFKALIKLLDQDLLGVFGEQQAFFDQFNKTDAIKQVVVLYAADEPVGCGAIKQYDDNTMEVKRVYVKPVFRGQKLGLTIMQQLESWTKELGYTHCILETGRGLDNAIKLYQNNGYKVIDNYGQYIGVENSICMMKAVG
jgi:GNAT superfamily N-acetyltransferase